MEMLKSCATWFNKTDFRHVLFSCVIIIICIGWATLFWCILDMTAFVQNPAAGQLGSGVGHAVFGVLDKFGLGSLSLRSPLVQFVPSYPFP